MSSLDPQSHIAIVGLACDFPQAATPSEFWAGLLAGQCAVEDFDDEALLAAGVTRAELADPDYVRAGIRLAGFDEFDAGFFGLSPREAAVMDPQHRRFLQCAWSALEHAGYRPDALDRQTGVFAGSGMHWYLLRNLFGQRELLEDMGEFLVRHLSNDKDFLSTRVSYQLDLRGPSLNVQTACSTSLVAVHLACQSLLGGECDMALAGGSTIEVPQGQGYRYREEEVRASDGRCRAFDAAASGTVFGSGCGLVVLRRLSDALRDGDSVYAVIRGTAINNDGAGKAGYLAPSVDGQAEAIATALTLAGVEPASIGYVETHGTGTRMGDPIELAALSQAFEGAPLQGCGIGSVKTNIGHLDTAAGVAGLIKTALCLHHGQLPPSLFFERPNPDIDFACSPFFVVDRLRDWPDQAGPRRAALNSLGVGGTNAFAVLEQAPLAARPPQAEDLAQAQPQLLLLSAKTPEALRRRVQDLSEWLIRTDAPLADIAWTLREGRVAFAMRTAICARSRAVAARQCAAIVSQPLTADSARPAARTPPALVFAFPGQGAQQVGMARDLYAREPAVREALDACCGHLREIGREEVVELLLQAEDSEAARQRINATEVTQPLLFCVEYALARGLLARGIRPAAAVGHSLGEYVAATVAGVFELGAAIGLICRRGELCASAAEGAMLAVAASADTLTAQLHGGVGIAGLNAPEQTVLSGPRARIDALAQQLQSDGISARRLPISGAFHSELLDPLLDAFRAAVTAAQPRRVDGLRIASTLTGQWLDSEQAASPEYWVRHLRQPVDFVAAQACLDSLGEHVLIEVGPGLTLGRLAQARSSQARSVAVLGARPVAESAAELDRWFALPGLLWAHGLPLELSRWQQPSAGRRVALPTYPFAADRHWIEPAAPSLPLAQAAPGGLQHWLQAQDWLNAPLLRPEQPATLDSVLVLMDAGGVGAALVTLLRERGTVVRTLGRGGQLDLRGSTLSIDPGSDAHWQALAELDSPSHLIDLWALDAFDAPDTVQQSLCFDWPLRMIQQLAPWAEREGGLVWLSAAINAQAAGEAYALEPMQSLRAGPLRTWPQEQPGVRSAWFDLDAGLVASAAVAARLLIDELDAGLPEDTVAWRGRRRLRPAWTALGLPRVRERAALKPAGRYLVTGAFGGAGQALVEHLARLPQVELILLTRSELPVAAEHPRRRWLAALQALGARLTLWVADVADSEALRRCAEDTDLRHLDGVFHAAGVLDDGLIARKDLQAAHRVIAPKRAGAEAVAALAERHGAAFVLYFSSLSAQMGASGQVDYTAANAFLDAFAARADAESSRTRHVALAFSIWREAGMAARLAAELGLAPAPLLDSTPLAHPLLRRRRDEAGGRVVFGGVFDAGSDWVLDQHRLRTGEALLPGTAYLDLIAYALAQLRGGFTPFRIEGLSFAAPFKLEGDDSRRLELSFTAEGEHAYTVELVSQGAEAEDRIEHLSVRLQLRAGSLPEPLRLDSARTPREPHYAHPQLRFGPHWDCLRGFELGSGEAELELARLELDAEAEALHPLHPALFDMAIGAAQAALAPAGIDAARLLPFRYGRLDVLAPLPAQLRSRQRARVEGGDLLLDVDLLAADGERVLVLRDFLLRPARSLGGAGRPKIARPQSLAAGGNRLLEVGFREGFSSADALAAIDSVLAHGGPAQIALARRPVAELVEDTRRPAIPEATDARTQTGSQEVPRSSAGTPFVAAEGELQQSIVSLWESLLALSGIGSADDFFALGGHSLLLTRALSRLKRDHGLVLPIEAAFETPTVAAWSQLAENAAPAARGPSLKRVDRSRYRADAAAT